MKTSRPKSFRFAALCILLSFAIFALVGWLWFTFETAGDNDACHVIAMELADAWKRPAYGKVPHETIDAVAMYLDKASVIGVKRTPDGPRAGFGSRFHAVADERGVTCSTDGWLRGWGARSVTVPWSERPGNPENPKDPWEPTTVPNSGSTWTPPKFSKVVAYRFRIPPGDEEVGHFTLLSNGKLDMSLLTSLQNRTVTLTDVQITRLQKALVTEQQYGFVACYIPHHIFVFQSATGDPAAAIEVCFVCREVSAIPPIPEALERRQDLVALAKLVDELGLWADKKPAEQWIAEHEAYMKE